MKFEDVVTAICKYVRKEKEKQDNARDKAKWLTEDKSNKQVYEMCKNASGYEKVALMEIYKNRCESENKR